MTFLAIDIGNTRLKWSLYAQGRPGAELIAAGAEFLENIGTLAEGAWRDMPAPSKVLGCTVAAEAVKHRVEEQLEERWDASPQWVYAQPAECGLVNGYDHPTRLGADRWVAMIGAWHRMKATASAAGRVGAEGLRPIVVVMVGTAVTVEAVEPIADGEGPRGQGRFVGGLILPGHGIMLRALEAGTAGLHVPTGDVRDFPTNTSDALTSGGTFAIAGAVARMVQHLQARTGHAPVCYMTGGAGWKMAPSMATPCELVDSLIFDGLLQIASERGAG